MMLNFGPKSSRGQGEFGSRWVPRADQPHVRTDPFLLPDHKVIKQHGDSTTQDREPVSDGYTARRYHGG